MVRTLYYDMQLVTDETTTILLSVQMRFQSSCSVLLRHLSRSTACSTLVNCAAVLRAPGELALESWPLAHGPPPGSVRIAVRALGVCGSDVHYWYVITAERSELQCAAELLIPTSAGGTDVLGRSSYERRWYAAPTVLTILPGLHSSILAM